LANRTLTIVAKVRDAASAGLDKIQRSLRSTGQAAKKTSVDFTEFNRIMFSTTAFVGLFTKSFANFGSTILKGAELDRVGSQFERVLGSKGQLFSAISDVTDNSIDKVEALRSAIQLKTLGMANNMSQVADIIARSGTAAKLAGIDSAEGIKRFTQFLKDGSVAHLEALNLTRSADPVLKTQLALVERMGGVFGGALSSQMKYTMGMRLLKAATNGALKGQRDLYDVIFDVKQSFGLLRNEVGIFLSTALSDVIDKITHLTDMFTAMLEHIRKNKKEILFLAKYLLVASSAMASFMAVFGTFRLVAKGLAALGFSAAPLIFTILGLTAAFQGLTHKVGEGLKPVERFVERLRLFGAIIKGITQLVKSYLYNQDNFAKGVGKIDEELFILLNNNSLFVFVHNASKSIAKLIKFVTDVKLEISKFSSFLDKTIGGSVHKFLSLFGVGKQLKVDLKATNSVIDETQVKRMSSILVGSSEKVHKFLVRGAAALLGVFAAYKLFGIGKGILAKIPFVGKFFKSEEKQSSRKQTLRERIFGSSKGPLGTKSDPIYVKIVDTLKNEAVETLARIALFKDMRGLLKKFPLLKNILKVPIVRILVKPILSGLDKIKTSFNIGTKVRGPIGATSGVFNIIKAPFVTVGKFLLNLFKPVTNLALRFAGVSSGLLRFAAIAGRAHAIITLVIAGFGLLTGIVKGITENFESFRSFFINMIGLFNTVDFSKIFSDVYNTAKDTIIGMAITIKESVSSLASTLYENLSEVFAPLQDIGLFIMTKLQEGFGVVQPYIEMVLSPLRDTFNTFMGWLDSVGNALKGFYDWLLNLPGVKTFVDAVVRTATDPGGVYKDLGEMLIRIPAMLMDEASRLAIKPITEDFFSRAKKGEQMPFQIGMMSSEQRGEYARSAFAFAQETKDERAKKAYMAAIAATSPEGGQISKEELAVIFGFALDNSKIAKNTEGIKDETQKANDSKKKLISARGGCA